MNKLTFICSYLCGGKSTLAKLLFDKLPKETSNIVEVGHFVRHLLKKDKREDLLGHPELSKEIIRMIIEMNDNYEHVIVSGVRQVSILQAFPQAELIWLDNSPNILYQRWLEREEEKDGGEKTPERFNNLIHGEKALGIELVKNYIITKNHIPTI